MSDLLALRDFDSAEFIDRIAGLFAHCAQLADRAATLREQTAARIYGMSRHTFDGLSEIGEALLRVQEKRPGEFETWFQAHHARLGFSLTHAERCKAAARLVREHGPERAYDLSLARAADRPEPLLAFSMRLTRPLEDLNPDELAALHKRLEPAVNISHQIERLSVSATKSARPAASSEGALTAARCQ